MNISVWAQHNGAKQTIIRAKIIDGHAFISYRQYTAACRRLKMILGDQLEWDNKAFWFACSEGFMSWRFAGEKYD